MIISSNRIITGDNGASRGPGWIFKGRLGDHAGLCASLRGYDRRKENLVVI